jgi:MFS family permease
MKSGKAKNPARKARNVTGQGAARSNVLWFGFTSFFTDLSSEFIYSLQAYFLKTLMAANSVLLGPVLGVIEGIAEATASLGKVIVGRIADRLKNYRKLTILGYAFSALSKLLFVVATAWGWIFGARFLDRIGKSIRTAPRDAIMSESGGKTGRGKAFGIQRAMDFAGAFLGVLVAMTVAGLLGFGTGRKIDPSVFRIVFLCSLIPAALGVIFLFFVKEPDSLKARKPGSKPGLTLSWKGTDPRLRTFLFATILFALGNSSNQFLILRCQDLGFTLFYALGGYLLYNLASTVTLPFFGKLSDRIGRRKILVAGYCLYAVVYAGFGLIGLREAWMIWPLWLLYGLYSGMTEGVEKAYVADLSVVDNRATSLGLFATVNGIGLLFASIAAGVLYAIGPAWPFLTGSALALVSVVVLLFTGGRGARSKA